MPPAILKVQRERRNDLNSSRSNGKAVSPMHSDQQCSQAAQDDTVCCFYGS